MELGWIFGRISVVAQYIRRILVENGGFWPKMGHFWPILAKNGQNWEKFLGSQKVGQKIFGKNAKFFFQNV